ncbi:MAG: sugar phosphate isomerase/epimerase [Bacteroidales bacterium]
METKREFLKKMSLLALGGGMAVRTPLQAMSGISGSSRGKKAAGLQIYSLGRELTENVPEGMKKIAGMGYTHLELAGYRDGKVGSYGVKEYRKIVEDAGLRCTGSHVNGPEMEISSSKLQGIADFWKRTVEDHVQLGVSTLVQPMMPAIATRDDVKVVCESFNQAGEIAKSAGIRWGYHNHNMEFRRIAKPGETPPSGPFASFIPFGDPIYDLLLQGTDPSLVFFEMDVYWTVMGQADPLEYFETYPNRFPVLHIKDRSILGASGMMNFPNIFTKAYEAGMESYYVELEAVKSGMSQFEGVKACYDFLEQAPYVKG